MEDIFFICLNLSFAGLFLPVLWAVRPQPGGALRVFAFIWMAVGYAALTSCLFAAAYTTRQR